MMNDSEKTSEPSLEWSDAYALGHPALDAVHEEFVDVARGLSNCTASNVLEALDALVIHLKDHFKEEDELMNSTEFPPRECHISEHAAVLESVVAVKEQVSKQLADVSLAHNLAAHLWRWFPAHVDHLDSALAAWLTKRLHGGKPVILRRSVGSSRGTRGLQASAA